jgi:hypothetical protein
MKLRYLSFAGAVALTLVVAACAGGDAEDAADTAGSEATRTPSAAEFFSFVRDWDTDFENALVGVREFQVGAPKDGIRSIDDPKFVPVADADFLDEREPVVAFELDGDARAYPVRILMFHEIVNDIVAGEPVAITYCPLCNSALVFDSTVDGVVYEFGVSGLLRNSDLVMFDRETETWWQQITGEGLVGTLAGSVLEVLPSSMLSFAEFRRAWPDGTVLSTDTGTGFSYGRNPYVEYDDPDARPFLFRGERDERLPAMERVVALEVEDDAAAYPFTELREASVVNDTVGGEPVVILYQPGTASALDTSDISEGRDVGTGVAFHRTLDGRTLTFEPAPDGTFRDAETGSTWGVTGRATAGALEGARLEPVVHGNHFWFSWAAFHPHTTIWSGGERG